MERLPAPSLVPTSQVPGTPDALASGPLIPDRGDNSAAGRPGLAPPEPLAVGAPNPQPSAYAPRPAEWVSFTDSGEPHPGSGWEQL